jgi:hypothetical protein
VRRLQIWPTILVFLGIAGGLGCGEDRPPSAPNPDGSRLDASSRNADASEPDANVRGPEPRLPPTDVDVVLPYRGPVVTHVIDVDADLGALDVCFSIDTTGSFGEEIDALQADVDGRIIPALRDRVEDVAFGVSHFEDFPADPYGADTDLPFELLTPVTTARARVGAAIAALDQPLGHGGDALESGAEALYQIATGAGYTRRGRRIVAAWDGRAAPGGGVLGGVGFRERALHVVVHVTDAPTHRPDDYLPDFPDTRSLDEAAAALREVGALVIGIASGEPARPHLERIALETGASFPANGGDCPTGVEGAFNPPFADRCPLVFDVANDGTGLSSTIVDAIVELVNGVEFGEVWGEPRDDRLGFVRAIEAARATPPDGVAPPTTDDLRPADGIVDTFVDVRTGTRLEFEVQLRNESIPPADYDQTFRIAVEILGDGLLLARRTFRITVPRGRLDAGMMDGGPIDASGSTDAGPPDAPGGG